jgi:hypothetical protein
MCVTKLDQPFANSKLMNALGIMYPQFWMQLDVDYAFSFQFAIIKKHYFEIKEVRVSFLQVKKIISANINWICRQAHSSLQ